MKNVGGAMRNLQKQLIPVKASHTAFLLGLRPELVR